VWRGERVNSNQPLSNLCKNKILMLGIIYRCIKHSLEKGYDGDGVEKQQGILRKTLKA
jgi:hypothetical protein